jgi:hypothetical protein
VKQPLQAPLCASGFVTVTFTAPAACAVVVPVIALALMVATVSADPPKETVAPLWNPLPLTVTDVPPAVGPLFGVTDATAGAATYVKQLEQLPLWPSGFVTTALTDPAACAVVVPVMLVALIVDTFTGDPPNDTLEPLWKPVPAIVTAAPPALGPPFGVTDATVGAATYVKQPVQVPLCASGFVTITFTPPAACALVDPVIEVALIVEMLSADPPNETVVPAWKPDPLTVTVVPPALGPLDGATDVTAGPATYVKHPAHVPV